MKHEEKIFARQLTDRFHIQSVRAKDLCHLSHRVTRKILSHTIAVDLNKSLGHSPIQLEKLIVS
jgi:hypothetical protein